MKNNATCLSVYIGILTAFALLFQIQTGAAVANNTTSVLVSATVSDTISVTLSFAPSGSAITFGSLNAGTYNNSATNNLNISIDSITNVATNISMNGTDFVSGGDNIPINNLRYSNVSGSTGLTGSTTMATTFSAPQFANWGNIAKPSGSNTYRDAYYWLTIPEGQNAGTYSTNIYINITKYQ